MQKTAVSWIIYSLTHSTFMLGLSLFASQFPSFLFSLIGGVISDRYNRHRVLIVTQVASMIQAALLTLLVFFNHYNVWMILGLSTLLGLINAFDVPARQSLVYEMVDDKEDLANALALNSSMVNLSRIIGPAFAGFLLQYLGDSYCFLLNTLSFIAVIGSLLMMKLPVFKAKKSTKNMLSELKEGLSYVKRTPSIAFVILMFGLVSLFVLPYSTLIPYYARHVFKGDASTFGIIDSAIGMGAFGGALFLASLKPGRNLQKILFINTLVLGAGLILFSHQNLYWLALIFAAVAGFGMMSQNAISNTLIQTSVAPEMRGRVISLYVMVFFGLQPIGSLVIGYLSTLVGPRETVLIAGVAAVCFALLHFRHLKNEKLKKEMQVLPEHEIDSNLL